MPRVFWVKFLHQLLSPLLSSEGRVPTWSKQVVHATRLLAFSFGPLRLYAQVAWSASDLLRPTLSWSTSVSLLSWMINAHLGGRTILTTCFKSWLTIYFKRPTMSGSLFANILNYVKRYLLEYDCNQLAPKSYSEEGTDESAEDGGLANALKFLRSLHQRFLGNIKMWGCCFMHDLHSWKLMNEMWNVLKVKNSLVQVLLIWLNISQHYSLFLNFLLSTLFLSSVYRKSSNRANNKAPNQLTLFFVRGSLVKQNKTEQMNSKRQKTKYMVLFLRRLTWNKIVCVTNKQK